MVTKLRMGDDVGDCYPYKKIHYDLIRGFATRSQAYSDSTLELFLWGDFSSSLQPRQDPAPIFSDHRHMTSFCARMCLLRVSKPKFYILTPVCVLVSGTLFCVCLERRLIHVSSWPCPLFTFHLTTAFIATSAN